MNQRPSTKPSFVGTVFSHTRGYRKFKPKLKNDPNQEKRLERANQGHGENIRESSRTHVGEGSRD